LKHAQSIAKAFRMGEDTGKIMAREERLAAKLRENLKRRKAQARNQQAGPDESSGLSKEGEQS
jgi:hypothetical protein